MRKFIGLLAVAGLALLSLSDLASASSNLPNGSVITATGTNISLGGLTTCESTIRGTVFNKAAGQGIHGVLESATFGPGCTPSGSSMGPTSLPWTFDTVGTTNGGSTWDLTVTGVHLDVLIFGVSCTFTGHVDGVYENATKEWDLHGVFHRGTSSSFLCPATASVAGGAHISPALTIS